jgi:hypothetical protein
MHRTLLVASALAGGLLMSTLIWKSAQAASAPDLKGALGHGGAVTLVGHGGGGHMGGGGGHMGGGGGHMGGGGGHMMSGGGGGRSMSGASGHFKSMSGGSGHLKSGAMGTRNFTNRNFNNGPGFKGRDRFAGNNWKDGTNAHDHGHKHVAMRDHDHHHHFDHFNRHRVFRNGVWIWVYGPDYYAGNDCYWLLRRARATGSPYWWSRYDACVGNY